MKVPHRHVPFNHPEIGRELKASELKENMIVWLKKENRQPLYASWWVREVAPEIVIFVSNLPHNVEMNFICKRDGDSLRDDTDVMRVFQYLGPDQPSQSCQ